MDNDHVAGTRSILDHLADAGAARVAPITGPPVHSCTLDSIAASRVWCRERSVEPEIARSRAA